MQAPTQQNARGTVFGGCERANVILRRKQLLEDQLFKRLRPNEFARIRALVNTKWGRARSRLLEEVVDDLREVIPRWRVIRVESRTKHLFSIYRKLRSKRYGPDQIQDLFGIRFICPTEADCRTVLSTLHRRYRPVPGRYKDYIATPKPSGYRSIHTTVLTPAGIPVEVQIRTLAMHFEAEEAHAEYKRLVQPITRHPITKHRVQS